MKLRPLLKPLLPILCGAASAIALPPLNLFVILWFTLPALLWDIDRRPTAKGAFLAGWLWGLGYFAAGLYWIANSFLVDAARFGWMIPFALTGLGAILGVYIGAAAAICRLVPSGWPRLLLFASAWGAMEWLRGLLFTGFPWNPLGSVWSQTLPVLQSVAIVGAYGLSVLTVLAAGAPVLFAASRRQGVAATMLGLVMLVGIFAWGAARIPPGPSPVQPDIRLRLVQANIAQTLKWAPGMAEEHLARHLALSKAASPTPPTHIIWPETAAPPFLDQDLGARQAVSEVTPPGGLMLVGTLRARVEGGKLAELWNSIEVIDGEGRIVGDYDKVHLVPFGEYVPLPSWIPIHKLTAVSLPISPGPAPKTLDMPGLPPVGALICYEAIFPHAVIDEAHRPAWMLNVTNDGWFGISSGPYQHFAAARMRAIEEGLPLVRAAYTGISAIVDPFGRAVIILGLGQEGVIDGPLPQPIAATLFSRYGYNIFTILLLIAAIPAFCARLIR